MLYNDLSETFGPLAYILVLLAVYYESCVCQDLKKW